MHRAIKTGKRVRAETRIQYNSVSVSYAAVELASEKLGGRGQVIADVFMDDNGDGIRQPGEAALKAGGAHNTMNQFAAV